jgi:hypothetical protein
MLEPCSEKDRLRQAYYEATREASATSRELASTPFGAADFTSALKKADGAQRASDAARRRTNSTAQNMGVIERSTVRGGRAALGRGSG